MADGENQTPDYSALIDRYENQDVSQWYSTIQRRVAQMPTAYWTQSPLTMAAIATQRQHSATIQRLADGAQSMHAWVSTRNTFGGVPGALIEVRRKALAIQDPQSKLDTLTAINDVAKLPPAEQQMFVAWAHQPVADPNAAPGVGRDQGPTQTSIPAEGTIQKILPGAELSNTGDVTVSADNVSPDQVAALQSAFPSLAGHIQFDETTGQTTIAGINANDWKESFSNTVLDRLAKPIGGPIVAAKGKGVKANIAAGALSVVGAVTAPLTLPIRAVGDVADVGASALPETFGLRDKALRAVRVAGHASSVAGEIMGDAAGNIGSPFADLLGYQRGTQAYDDAKNAIGGTVLAVLLHGSSEALGTAKVAGSTEAGYAAGQLGLVTDEAGHALALDTLKSTINDVGLRGVLEHPMRALLDPAVKSVVYNIAKTPYEEWLNGGRAGELFDYAQKLLDESPRTAKADLIERYNLDPRLVDEVLGAGSREMMPRAAQGYFEDITHAGDRMGALQDSHKALAKEAKVLQKSVDEATKKWQSEGGSTGAPGEGGAFDELVNAQHRLDDVKAQILASDQALADAVPTSEPQFRYPNSKTLVDFLHRAFGNPVTPLENVFRAVLNPVGKLKTWSNAAFDSDFAQHQPFLTKFTDKLDYAPKLYNLSETGLPLDAVDQNAQVLTRFGRRLGIPQEEMTGIHQDFLDVKNSQDFYEALDGLYKTVDRYLPENTPIAVRRQLTTFSKRVSEDYPVGILDENGMREPLLPAADGHSKPSLPNEFINHTKLPNLDQIDSAVRAVRRWQVNAQELGGAQKFASTVYQTGKSIMHASTSIFKPIQLGVGLKTVPIVLRKTIDEALGNAASPNFMGSIRSTSELVRAFTTPDPAVIGSGIADVFEHVDTVKAIENVAVRDLVARNLQDDPAVWATQVDALRFLHKDPIAREFARGGLDVAKMKEMLTDGTGNLSREWASGGARTTAEVGMDIDTYLNRLKTAIEQTAFHDPALIDAVGHGHVLVDNSGSVLFDESGNNLIRMHSRLTQEADALQERISAPDITTAEKRALQAELKTNTEKLSDIEGRVPDVGSLKTKIVKMEELQTFGRYLKTKWQSGELQLPERIKIDRQVVRQGYGPASVAESMDEWATKFSTTLYKRFKTIGKMEAKLAKGAFDQQRAYQYFQGFKQAGYDAETAQAFAEMRAATETRDMFYDMSARSTIERSVRNTFWYAPLQGELLYRWLYAVPAQSYWLPGLAINVAKAENYINLFKDLGIVHHDPVDNSLQTTIPGLGKLLEAVSGGNIKVPENLNVPLSSLSHLQLDAVAPSLSPLPGMALSEAAKTRGGVFRDIANVIDPYGDATEFVPTGIRYALETLGIKPPDVNADYIKQQYDRTHSEAIQYAYEDLSTHGDKEPSLAQFHLDASQKDYKLSDENQKLYMDEWKAWNDRLMSTANEYARGMFAVKTLQSFAFPGQINYSSDAQQAYEKFFNDHVAPQLDTGTDVQKQEAFSQLDKWLGHNPTSLPYSISVNKYTGRVYEPPYKDSGDQYYRDLYLHGVKDAYTPAEYGEVLSAMMSKAAFDSRTNASIDQIAPTGDWKDVITNWGKRKTAVDSGNVNWQNYLNTHDQAKGIIESAEANMAKSKGSPLKSLELTYLNNILTSSNAVAGFFSGENGLPDKEFQSFLGQVRSYRAELYDSTGGDLTPMEKGISDYFDKVLTPYMKETQPLYNQAQDRLNAGLDASDIYAQISGIKEKYSQVQIDGSAAPSPDEFFYGSKAPKAQTYALANWATKPPSWLSSWQREKVGYATFQGEDEMWTAISGIKDQVAQGIADNNVSPGSLQYDAAQQWSKAQQASIAAQYGEAGVKALEMENATPATRLQSTGFGAGDANFENIVSQANYISQTLESQGLSGGGYSQEAVAAKQYLYQQIQEAQLQDPEFKKLMTTLSFSLPAASASSTQRTGAELYEAVFFGQFTSTYIPQTLSDTYAVGTGAV